MTISFQRYVDITSGVIGSQPAGPRTLSGLVYTSNPLLPPGSQVVFSGGALAAIASCAAYFGTASEEYARTVFYFSYISKTIKQATQITFARWVNNAVAPVIFGDPKNTGLLAAFQQVTAGGFTMQLGGQSYSFGPLNLSAANSFAAVATIIQAAINAKSGTLWSAASVTYDPTRNAFNFTGGVATSSGTTPVTITDGAQTLATLLGWATAGTILGAGSAAQLPTDALTATTNYSNNFGSFCWMPALTLQQAQSIAAWNAAQNVLYMASFQVPPANAAAWSAGLIGYAGTALTLNITAGEYPEMAPMSILAATDYTGIGATQNYMFQQFALTPSVSNDNDANTYDALRVNYYGVTQDAGQNISFYQRGIMMGGVTAPVDMNVYANEQWMKSTATGLILSLELALAEIPANASGALAISTTLQAGLIGSTTTPGTALGNGCISVGKTLSAAQILAVTNATADPNAWRQVQAVGYWLGVNIQEYNNSNTGLPEYKATYVLVYSKKDDIRLVTGQHELV